ncbi:uncharacterized protein LOC110390978 [Numida meleagris]|uniref:uncharacterized protein LOC110390978 n=1 Tax=Numida meleagris TaxID=8996 RepID=UPI000B3DFB4C|nr:uncharacterized protein LOC110390978 [Numida meleagris]
MVMTSRFQHTMILHIILFLQIVHLVKGQFKIIPPNNPVLGIVGKGVTLPCQLEAKTISERLSVQWIFSGKTANIDVTTYDGKNTLNPVREEKTYQGRTHFFQTEINKGNLSLHLKNVMISDKGKYICSVSLENWYDEVIVDLDVAAQGDESAVVLDGHVGQGIGLNCKSQGWFPQPDVIWMDSKGQTRKEKVVTQSTKTSLGLFDVASSMTLEPGSDMEVSCRIINGLLNTACESRVLISDVFFPYTSAWMTAFLVISCCSVAVLAAVGYKLKSNGMHVNAQNALKMKNKKKVSNEELKSQKQQLLHRQEKTVLTQLFNRQEADLDFWKAWDKAVPITLNPECQLLQLQVPGAPDVEDNACEPAGLSSPSTVPVLVAKEGFSSGKHYWEVEVAQQQDWVLGVMRQKGKQEEQGTLAGDDYWALLKSRGEIFSIKGNSRLEKNNMNDSVIGVLLDLEEAQIYFCGTEQMSTMMKIPMSLGKESAEVFYPFLSKGEGRFKPLDTQKFMGPGGLPHRVLRELADVVAKPLPIILRQSWLTGYVPVDWRLANVMPIFKKGRKNDPGQIRIIPSYDPVVGVIGKGVILPCQLEAKTVTKGLLVQWIFTGKSPNIEVTTYDGKNPQNPVREDKAYLGRTNIFQSEVNKGNLSLHLKNVMTSDKGKYICSVSLENWYDEVMVDLDVAAQGDESAVVLDGHVGQGIGLNCKSQGWFPQPDVIWMDSKGQTRKEKAITQSTKTSLGLFDVVSSMTLEPGSDMEVSCRIINDLLNTACESRVLISDFWKAQEKAVPISLYPECRLLQLQVPGPPDVEDNACEPAGLSSASTVPVLVAKDGFSAGKHYWEVEVGQQLDWVLGVMRQKGKEEEQGTLAGDDYWALHRSRGEIFSIKGNSRLEKKDMNYSVIGVLLDLEEAQIYFYGTEQGSQMLRIPISLRKESAEEFYPFLSKGEGRFKPVCHQNIPVPLKEP